MRSTVRSSGEIWQALRRTAGTCKVNDQCGWYPVRTVLKRNLKVCLLDEELAVTLGIKLQALRSVRRLEEQVVVVQFNRDDAIGCFCLVFAHMRTQKLGRYLGLLPFLQLLRANGSFERKTRPEQMPRESTITGCAVGKNNDANMGCRVVSDGGRVAERAAFMGFEG
jgi:hypothetical protein